MRHRGAIVRPLAALTAALAVAVASACTLLNPLDGYTGGSPQVEASVEAEAPKEAGDASVPDTSGCESSRPPARLVGGPGGGNTTIVNALASFETGDPKDPTLPNTTGYDLDKTCTCPGPRSCKPSRGGGVCDFPNGVDNSAGVFFLSMVTVLGSGNSETARIRRGLSGLLFRVRNYNDQPDDDEVELSIFDTLGLEGVRDAGTGVDASIAPKLDGTDRWTVDARSLLGGTPYLPIVVDTRAYVRGGVVVGSINHAIRVGFYTLPLVGAIVTGKLVKTGETYAVSEGVLSGRFNARDLLTALETVPNPLVSSGYLCGEDPLYRNTRDIVCANLDLPTDQALDGRDTPCDAVSIAARFSTVPAVLGDVVDPGPRKKPCGAAWVGECPSAP